MGRYVRSDLCGGRIYYCLILGLLSICCSRTISFGCLLSCCDVSHDGEWSKLLPQQVWNIDQNAPDRSLSQSLWRVLWPRPSQLRKPVDTTGFHDSTSNTTEPSQFKTYEHLQTNGSTNTRQYSASAFCLATHYSSTSSSSSRNFRTTSRGNGYIRSVAADTP